MKHLPQNLYITFSNQRARDLKSSGAIGVLDKVITLDGLILEMFERSHFEYIIDEMLATSIIYRIIQEHNLHYFDYLKEDALSLKTIYHFIIKCHRNAIAFDRLLDSPKLDAIEKINEHYQAYKKAYALVDSADIEEMVLNQWNDSLFAPFTEVFVDHFVIGDICFIKSAKQQKILEKLSSFTPLHVKSTEYPPAKLIQPSNEVFDAIDEVKTALKIARHLLEQDVSADDIVIVASDIVEYGSLYKLFLDDYALKGYSSIGTPLTHFFNSDNPKVMAALNSHKANIESLRKRYQSLGLTLSKSTEEAIKANIRLLDEKVGIELTEPNQLVGLSRRYKHIIFIGTDINHFPPKASDNFLYSYEDDINNFYANDYFTSSQTQLNELKRVGDNLYIITAMYSDKRELKRSILIGNIFDDTIDVTQVQSLSQLALNHQTKTPDEKTEKYYQSITDQALSVFDGNGVEGLHATHLSASQINKYLSCPLAYLYANKVKIKAPNQAEEGFDVMEQGSLMHLCYQLFGEVIKIKKLTCKDKDTLYTLMYEISIEAYNHESTLKDRGEENIHHQIFLSSLQAGLKDDRTPGLLAKFVNYYIENAEAFNYFHTTDFEKEFALDSELKPYIVKDKEDKNYFIKGFIDRFDYLEKQINIIDYKSKKVERLDKEKQEQVNTHKDIQLALYILYAKQQYPNKIYDSYLLSFKGNDKGVKFAALSNDGVYDDTYEESLKNLIVDTKESIEAGKFGFNNSDEKTCGYCDYKFLCHESVLNKNKIDGE